MKLHQRCLIYFEILVLMCAGAALCSCTKAANKEEALASFGLTISILQGNNQTSAADKLFPIPLQVQVTNDTGEGVKDLEVTFIESTSSRLVIATPTATTSSAGVAQTSVRSPATYNQSSIVRACIKGSSTCSTFRLSSDASTQNVRFNLTTQHNSIETAGVNFALTVTTVDSTTGFIVDVNETINLDWTFVTDSSWSGIAPTLVPAIEPCTFVAGVCNVTTTVNLTDAIKPTRVFVGDGDGGFIDVFGKAITVIPNIPVNTIVTDKLGGPLNGAVTIRNSTYNVDMPPVTFYSAIVDSVGNYIADPGVAATWSSSKPLEITGHLSTTVGSSTTLTFAKSIPYPDFGTITATVAGFTPLPTGNLWIGPGAPASAKLVPVDGNYNRYAGTPFNFEVWVLDAKGNVVTQHTNSNGFTSNSLPVTITFSNYFTPPEPTGGTVPLLVPDVATYVVPQVTQTIRLPFYGGKAQFLTNMITFWDATGVTPNVNVSINTVTELSFPTTYADTVTGNSAYTVSIDPNPANYHLMLRTSAGPTAEPLCKQSFSVGTPSSSATLPKIIDNNYLTSSKADCNGLVVQTDHAPIDMYASVEDIAGNFVANLTVNWITTDPSILVTPSDFGPMLSATNAAMSTLTPSSVTSNQPKFRWLRIQGTYSGVAYDQYFLGQVSPGNLSSFELRVRKKSAPHNEADATSLNTLVIIPKDANGNEITSPFIRNLNVTVTNPPTNGNDASTPVFISSGPVAMQFSQYWATTTDNITDSTAVGKFDNLFTPHAGDIVNITVQDAGNPLVTGTIAYKVIPGSNSQIRIYRNQNYPAGTDVTNVSFQLTTDDTLTLYATMFDAHLNVVNPDFANTSWNTSPQPFVPANSVSGMAVIGNVTPVNPDVPGTGIIQVVKANAGPGSPASSSRTGVITIVPGAPKNIVISSATTVNAGTPMNVTASVQDQKGNVVTSFNGINNLSINILDNDYTRLGFRDIIPASGNYNFTNGTYTFSGSEAFTFFNSIHSPRVQIATTSGSPIVGQSGLVTVNPSTFDHLALLTGYTLISAGNSNVYTIIAEDLYGNKLSTGVDSTKNVTFDITSTLGDEDITASTLTSSSISNYSLLNQKTITGNLTAGSADVTVTSTKSGLFTVSGNTIGIAGTNTQDSLTVTPLTTVNSMRFKPGSAPISPTSAINPLFPFTPQVLDIYGNVITSNSFGTINLALYGATESLLNYTPRTLVTGETTFSGLEYKKAESFTLRAEYGPNPAIYVESPMTVQIGTASQTIVKLPNQIRQQGQVSLAGAITGTPFSTGNVGAGTTFSVEVTAVDNAFNTATSHAGMVSLVSTDPYLEVTPASQNFVAGVATFSVKVRRQGGAHTITAVTSFTDIPSTTYTVNVGPATQLLALLPSQSLSEGAPDLATALSGVVPHQTAGTSFISTVKAVDAYYNQVTTFSHANIALAFGNDSVAPAPANKSMSGGSVNFTLTNYKGATGHTVIPSTVGGTSLNSSASALYEVKASSATQYIAVFPGQTHSPGQSPGNYAAAVTGTPTAQNTDTGFSVNIYAVDTHYNIRTDYTGAVTITTPSDPSDATPVGSNGGNFVAGSETFTINAVTAAPSQSITVTTGLATNTPASYNVNPGAPSKLIAIFTSYQTLDQGHTSLAAALNDITIKTRTSGEVVAVRVYATDAKYNVVNDSSTSVSLNHTLPSSNYSVSPTSQVLSSGVANFTLTTFLTGSNFRVTPAGTGYSVNASTDYHVSIGASKKLLIIMNGQTFVPGQATSALAASGTPSNQTQGSGFTFPVKVIAVDDYFNKRTTDIDSVTLTPSLASSVASNPMNLVAGEVTFSVYHTTNGNSNSITASSGAHTGIASKSYDVLAPLVNPTLALSDGTTNSTSYIRQTIAATAIGADATANRWCVSETQSTRPTSGTNGRTTCNGGAGTDMGWETGRPTSFVVNGGTQGSKTVYLWTADSANNVSPSAVSSIITLDSILPANPSAVSLTDTGTSSTTYSSSANVNITATLSADTTHWCTVEQPAANPAPTGPLYNNACWATKPGSFPQIVTLGAQGNRSVYVFAKDVAGNVSSSYSFASITYDSIAPVFPVGADILGAKGGSDTVANAYLSGGLVPTIQWQAATDASSPVTYTLTLKLAGTPVCSSPINTTSTSHTFTGCNLADGQTYTVELIAKDPSLNAAVADNNGFSFAVDATPPSSFTVTGMDDGGNDTTVDAWLTDSLTNPRLSWNDTTGEDGYNVYIETSGGVQVANCLAVAAANATNLQSFSGCSLSDNTNYRMRVVAFDTSGNLTEASNSPFAFTTSQGIKDFLVELVAPGDKVAGASFQVKLTARRSDGSIATNYTGAKAITWGTTATNGVDVCSSGALISPEAAISTQVFASGVATTTSSFILKKIQSGVTITATDGSGKTGTSTAINVTAAANYCTRIETAAGGVGSALGTQSVAIDATVNAFAVGRDAFGNYTGDQSVSWTGTGVVALLPVPETGTSTRVVAAKAGTGNLVASGAIAPVSFTIGTGTATWTTANDADGKARLGSNNVTAVYYWDVMADAVTSWRTAASSWHDETAGSHRGLRADFPTRAILVGTTGGLSILDASTNRLYMRFQNGTNYPIDIANFGNIADITALNGKIYVSMNGTSGNLIIIDLINDQVYRTNGTNRQLSTNNILNRNTGATWNANTTYPLTSRDKVGKLFARRIGGVDYLAIGTDASVDLMRTSGTTTLYKYASVGAVKGVALTSNGILYFTEEGVGVSRASLSLPLAANFSPDAGVTYTTATNAKTLSMSYYDIAVGEGTSSADAGKNTVVVATSLGLTTIQEHGTFASSTSSNYGMLGTSTPGATALFAGISEIVNAIDLVVSSGSVTVHLVTSGGWSELRSAQTASATLSASNTSIAAVDVKAYHADAYNDNDILCGLTSTGLHLNRR